MTFRNNLPTVIGNNDNRKGVDLDQNRDNCDNWITCG